MLLQRKKYLGHEVPVYTLPCDKPSDTYAHTLRVFYKHFHKIYLSHDKECCDGPSKRKKQMAIVTFLINSYTPA